MYEYSALRPLTLDFPALWEQAQLMTRREQIAVTLSLLNIAYKFIVIMTAIRLQTALSRREDELIAEATVGSGSSSGEAVKTGALSAQDSVASP